MGVLDDVGEYYDAARISPIPNVEAVHGDAPGKPLRGWLNDALEY